MSRGLTIGEDRTGVLGVRGKEDLNILEYTNDLQQVRCLHASQKFRSHTHFLTFTCNQQTYFVDTPINQWIDYIQWRKKHPGFNYMSTLDKK